MNTKINYSLRLYVYAAQLNIDVPDSELDGTPPRTTEEILVWLTQHGYAPPPFALEIWWRLQDRLTQMPDSYKYRSDADFLPFTFPVERLDGHSSELSLVWQGEEIVLIGSTENEYDMAQGAVVARAGTAGKTPLELTETLLPALLNWHEAENMKWPKVLLPLRAPLEKRGLTFAWHALPCSFEFGTLGMELRLIRHTGGQDAPWEVITLSGRDYYCRLAEHLGQFASLEEAVSHVASELTNGYGPFPLESTLEFLEGGNHRPAPWTIGPGGDWSAAAKRRLKRLAKKASGELAAAMDSYRRKEMLMEI